MSSIAAISDRHVSERQARRDRALLEQPEKLPEDPPARVRVVESFRVNGRVAQIGEIISIPRSDAAGVVALGRAEFA